jgi:hypothetical protein
VKLIIKKNDIYIQISMSKTTRRPDRILPSLLDHYKSYGKWRITTRDATLYALSVGFNLGKNPIIKTL